MKILVTIIFVLLLNIYLYPQDTLHVPSEYQSIQDAINNSVHGDLVLVAEGTYYENIKFNGKKIIVASYFIIDSINSHIDNTIINGGSWTNPANASVVSFTNNEDTNSVLCGFTITGGAGNLAQHLFTSAIMGGGIFVSSGCTIINNKIKGNNLNNQVVNNGALGGGIACVLDDNEKVIIKANEICSNTVYSVKASGGGGIYIEGSLNSRISDNIIRNNSVSASNPFSWISGGGGIYAAAYHGEIKKNLIVKNTGTLGGGLLATATFDPSGFSIRMINNTIADNTALLQGGGIYLYSGYANCTNNIIWGNTAPKDSSIFYRGEIDFNYSISEKEMDGTGNLQTNPSFIDTFYHIGSGSPAIDAGNPAILFNDYENPLTPGIALWPAIGTTRNDIGVFGGTDSACLGTCSFHMAEDFKPFSIPEVLYRLAYPEGYDSTLRYPMTIVLHGTDALGNNNTSQVYLSLNWRSNALAYGYNEFTVAPQAPVSGWSLSAINTLVEHLKNTLPVDTTRIVITGVSLGGNVVGPILGAYPRQYSAGIAVSGLVNASNLQNIPLWVFHGANDEIISVNGVRITINKIENAGITGLRTYGMSEPGLDSAISAGAQFLYTEYPEGDHFIVSRVVWDNPYLFNWLKLRKRSLIFPDEVWKTPELNIHQGEPLIIRGKFHNPGNLAAEYHVIIERTDNNPIQTIQLFDDGQHYDLLANDGIWGNITGSIPEENIFRININVINSTFNQSFNFRELQRFTTAYPLIIDSISVIQFPTYWFARPHFRNKSGTITVQDATMKFVCNDTCVNSIYPSNVNMGDLSPGEEFNYNFRINFNSSLFTGYFNYKFEITSNGWHLWTTDTTVTGIEEIQPAKLSFWLAQNYPNPFNPSTKIKYTVPRSSKVQIKVFDALGNEIKTLVNEEKPAGTYELTWNAFNLPSGVYFYQLKAGDFVETKKMILMK